MINLLPVMKKPTRKAPNRIKLAANVTLSREAIQKGKLLAESMGIKFSQLLEMLLREEVRKRGGTVGETQGEHSDN